MGWAKRGNAHCRGVRIGISNHERPSLEDFTIRSLQKGEGAVTLVVIKSAWVLAARNGEEVMAGR